MNADGIDKNFNNIGSVKVLDTKSVQQVKYFVDNLDKTTLHLSRTYLGNYAEGETAYFMVRYALDKNAVASTTGTLVT